MVCAEPVVADTHNTVAAVLHPHSLDSRNQAGKHCREVTLAIIFINNCFSNSILGLFILI